MTTELAGKIGNPKIVDFGNFTAGEIPDDLVYTYLNYLGAAKDLTGASVYTFDFQVAGAPPAVAKVATPVDLPNGQLGYAWVAADMAVPGHYEGKFWVTDASGKVFASLLIRWYVATAIKAP